MGQSRRSAPVQQQQKGDQKTRLSGKSALGSGQAHVALWVTTVVGLAADLVSKNWAVRTLGLPGGHQRRIEIIADYFAFQTVENPGAVAGWASGRTMLLIVVSIVALFFLFWLFASSRSHQRFVHVGLGLLFGGALGNLYNRVFNNGLVVDFIEVDLHFWPANPWPTFNVADVLLCAGVVALLLHVLGQSSDQGEK